MSKTLRDYIVTVTPKFRTHTNPGYTHEIEATSRDEAIKKARAWYIEQYQDWGHCSATYSAKLKEKPLRELSDRLKPLFVPS